MKPLNHAFSGYATTIFEVCVVQLGWNAAAVAALWLQNGINRVPAGLVPALSNTSAIDGTDINALCATSRWSCARSMLQHTTV
jgi:hypothetical protein